MGHEASEWPSVVLRRNLLNKIESNCYSFFLLALYVIWNFRTFYILKIWFDKKKSRPTLKNDNVNCIYYVPYCPLRRQRPPLRSRKLKFWLTESFEPIWCNSLVGFWNLEWLGYPFRKVFHASAVITSRSSFHN
jgi:hypothetical protein